MPGKFEGEPSYVEYFYNEVMDGGGDSSITVGDDTYDFFIINPADISDYPDLEDHYGIMITEDHNGFVFHKLFKTEKEYNHEIERLENEAEEIYGDEESE